MYGRPAGRPLTETRDYAAHTKKGQLRGRMANELLAAHQAGNVSVAIGRASDYFGPRGGAQSNLGDRLFPAALDGKTASVLGDPDQPHTYTYIPDIGEGLAVLGEHPDAPGQVWHLPNDPDTHTTRELADIVFKLAGQPRTRLRRAPPLLLRLAALTNATGRELLEMQYQFEEPSSWTAARSRPSEPPRHPSSEALADTLAGYQPRTNTNSAIATPGSRPDTTDMTRTADRAPSISHRTQAIKGHDRPTPRRAATRTPAADISKTIEYCHHDLPFSSPRKKLSSLAWYCWALPSVGAC